MKAVGCYSKAIKLAPEDERLYSNRSAALCQLNKFSKAIADGEKCVQLKPEWAKGHYRLGQAQLGFNKGDLAVASLERALELDPTMEDIEEFAKVRALLSHHVSCGTPVVHSTNTRENQYSGRGSTQSALDPPVISSYDHLWQPMTSDLTL